MGMDMGMGMGMGHPWFVELDRPVQDQRYSGEIKTAGCEIMTMGGDNGDDDDDR